MELLSSFSIDKKFKEPIREMMLMKLKAELNEKPKEKLETKKAIAQLQKKIDKLEERFALGEITSEIFDKFHVKYKMEQEAFFEEIEESKFSLSNLEKGVDKGLKMLTNLKKMWELSTYYEKQRLQNILFPEGILYNKEKNHYRTFRANMALVQIASLSSSLEPKKHKHPSNNAWVSGLVAGTGLEPVTFGL